MDEFEYDRRRHRQRSTGEARADGLERRARASMSAAAEVLTPTPGSAPTTAGALPGIVKPLPPQWFIPHDTNAEMRWDTLQGTGFHTPVERFFVRNHTSTPLIDPVGWRLRVFGSGLHGGGTEFTLEDLKRLPSTQISAIVECAGNARSYYTTQQHQPVPGTPWKLGGVGAARWRGVRLADLLRHAGLTAAAVDVLPVGLDPDYVVGGVNFGRVRRPLPIAKALYDVIVAYEMNGEPLQPDHGAPARLIVPGWVGIASIKWLGSIEVAAEPLYSPWNTDFYRMFGPEYPAGGDVPLTGQMVKSVFELAHDAVLRAGAGHLLQGRSWSGSEAIRGVEVSWDGGIRWHRARLHDRPRPDNWTRWSLPWEPAGPGAYELRARATDRLGNGQPETSAFNREGYLFGAVVVHPVTVI